MKTNKGVKITTLLFAMESKSDREKASPLIVHFIAIAHVLPPDQSGRFASG